MLELVLAAGLTLPTGADLEKAYWDCDFATTQTMLGGDEAMYCSQIFEKLKADKFGGDFDKFMAYWRENKKREHAARTKK